MRIMRVGELAKFMIARDTARQNKEADQPKPWTKDPILQTFRFCNVHREDDAVTRWLRKNWYAGSPFAGSEDIWFAAVVARLLNLPDSLMAVRTAVLPWKPAAFQRALHHRKAQGAKNFNAAYIVSTNGVAMDKVEYLVKRVLGPLWADRKKLRPRSGTLAEYHKRLMEYDGLGSFIAAQVIADLKYMPPFFDENIGIPTAFADDWYSFAASGPGSRRGLNRVMERSADYHQSEISWRMELGALAHALPHKLPFHIGKGLHAQDVQNCLCEFDKYERIRTGEGRPKQLYPGKA
jgi:hypothetical protein